MSLSSLARLAAGHRGNLLGEPQAIALPGLCPVFTFVCPVRLPPGCVPRPGRIRGRIGSGSALAQKTAWCTCLLEGIERYSLQYRDGDPAILMSTGLSRTVKGSFDARDLLLGHPGRSADLPPVDSRGCAAGDSLADAAFRGMLELIEHEALADWHSGRGQFAPSAPGADLSIAAIRRWLAGQQRQIRFLRIRHKSGASVFLCVCSDADGSRPAIGSAAGFRPAQTRLHACLEAVLLSFNLEAIDRNKPDEAEMTPADRHTLALYRGDVALPEAHGHAPTAPSVRKTGKPLQMLKPDSRQTLDALIRASAMKVAIFDLTRPEASIATVRVYPVSSA